jgi:hypothetical protein
MRVLDFLGFVGIRGTLGGGRGYVWGEGEEEL